MASASQADELRAGRVRRAVAALAAVCSVFAPAAHAQTIRVDNTARLEFVQPDPGR